VRVDPRPITTKSPEEKEMGSLNRVILIGRLGMDPDERMTAGGTRVSSFRIATDHFRSGNGDPQRITEWHRIVSYGKIAEQCNQFLRKGRLVCVEGSLQTRSWEKPPGEKHYSTEVVAARVTFLDSKTKECGPPVETDSDTEIP
jgi:single-strand DNA-binding protein